MSAMIDDKSQTIKRSEKMAAARRRMIDMKEIDWSATQKWSFNQIQRSKRACNDWFDNPIHRQ